MTRAQLYDAVSNGVCEQFDILQIFGLVVIHLLLGAWTWGIGFV